MCQRTPKMPRHIERHGCRNLNVFWLLGPQKSPDFWIVVFLKFMETICLQTRIYTQKTHAKRHLTIQRFFVSCGLDFIFLWLPFFQPELPDLLMSPHGETAPKWFFPPNWMIGKQIMTKHQWFVWEPFWFMLHMFQTHFYPLGFLKIPEVIHSDCCLIECLSDCHVIQGFFCHRRQLPGCPACHSGGDLDCCPGFSANCFSWT